MVAVIFVIADFLNVDIGDPQPLKKQFRHGEIAEAVAPVFGQHGVGGLTPIFPVGVAALAERLAGPAVNGIDLFLGGGPIPEQCIQQGVSGRVNGICLRQCFSRAGGGRRRF